MGEGGAHRPASVFPPLWDSPRPPPKHPHSPQVGVVFANVCVRVCCCSCRATHSYTVRISMFEIYNESVRDLLAGSEDATCTCPGLPRSRTNTAPHNILSQSLSPPRFFKGQLAAPLTITPLLPDSVATRCSRASGGHQCRCCAPRVGIVLCGDEQVCVGAAGLGSVQ